MKKIKYKLLALLLLAVFSGWSKDFSLKKIDTDYSRSLEKYFNKYTVCEIPLTEISNYVNQCSAKINFGLELSDRKFALQLELNDMRGKNYKAIAMTDHGQEEIPQTIANTYKGITDDKAGNIVRLTIDENTFEGYIMQNGQQFYCEPLKNFNSNAPANQFVIYDAGDVKPNNSFVCAADEVKHEKQRWDNKKDALNKMQTGNCDFAEIATEADYEYYQTFASAAVTLNRIRTILNQVEGIYTGTFYMKFIIVYQQIWTTVNDPYAGTTVQNLKSEFTDWWDINRSNIDRDVTHMFSNIVPTNNSNGYASIEAVCTGDYYSVVLHSSPFSLCVNLSAHELGHNFGGFHDFSCNLVIMCPTTPSGSAGWGNQTPAEIATYIAGTSCMEETYSNTTTVFGFGPYSYAKAIGINLVNINSAFSPVEITNGGFAYFESGNEIVIAPTNPNTTGFIANTGSSVLMRISDLSNTCVTLSKLAGENNNNFDDIGFSIYPNPANDFITIKINNASSKTTLKIYNSTMQLIKTLNFESGIENTISTADFTNGIYFIDAQSDNQHWRQKFIINR